MIKGQSKGSPAAAAAAAAPLNWREAELSRPTTAIEAMSENKLKRVREAAPSLGLTGASFKIPAADDIAAATMSWASNLPAVVASMTPAEKAQVWDEFQHASMSKAAELAYSELEAGDEMLDDFGAYPGGEAVAGGDGSLEEPAPSVPLPPIVVPQNVEVSGGELLSQRSGESDLNSYGTGLASDVQPTLSYAGSEDSVNHEVQLAAALGTMLRGLEITKGDIWGTNPTAGNEMGSRLSKKNDKGRM